MAKKNKNKKDKWSWLWVAFLLILSTAIFVVWGYLRPEAIGWEYDAITYGRGITTVGLILYLVFLPFAFSPGKLLGFRE